MEKAVKPLQTLFSDSLHEVEAGGVMASLLWGRLAREVRQYPAVHPIDHSFDGFTQTSTFTAVSENRTYCDLVCGVSKTLGSL